MKLRKLLGAHRYSLESMVIKRKPGEIYFLRELSLTSDEFTPFCKVGLVAKNRTTEQRIKEHQTGNPRKIVEQAIIKTNAVNSLETYLHDRLSPHRVAGEWFELDEQQFESVVSEANLVATQLREMDAALSDAVALKTTPSESAKISPRDVDLEQHRSLLAIKRQVLILEAEQKILELKLRHEMGHRAGIVGMIAVTAVAPPEKLDQSKLKREHPKIFSRFLVPQPDKVVGAFKVIASPTKRDLPAHLVEEINKLQSKLDGSHIDLKSGSLDRVSKEIRRTYQQYLKIESQLAELRLQAAMLETLLQQACSTNSGIAGVCVWKRASKVQPPKFDAEKFKSHYSDLYSTCLVKPRSSVRVSFKPPRLKSVE